MSTSLCLHKGKVILRHTVYSKINKIINFSFRASWNSFLKWLKDVEPIKGFMIFISLKLLFLSYGEKIFLSHFCISECSVLWDKRSFIYITMIIDNALLRYLYSTMIVHSPPIFPGTHEIWSNLGARRFYTGLNTPISHLQSWTKVLRKITLVLLVLFRTR